MKMRELPFNPQYSPEVYEQAKQWLVDNQPKFGSTANFAVFASNGVVESRINQVCHRAISSSSLPDRCLVVSEVGVRRRPPAKAPFTGGPPQDWELDWRDAEPFLRWWLYESYMGRFILNRDDIEFIKQYGIIVSADMPAPLLQNIMIVSRHFYEVYNESFRLFRQFTEKGLDPRIAYMMLFNTGFSLGNQIVEGLATAYSNHRAHPMLGLDAMQNFLDDEIGTRFRAAHKKELTDPALLYRTSLAYTGGVLFFANKAEDAPQFVDGGYHHFVYGLCRIEEFREALKAHRHARNNVEMYRPPNPFKRVVPGHLAPTAPDQVSYKELFEFVVPYLIENPHILRSQEENINAIAA